MGRASLKDIAKRVGVSIALVSYVLNNQKQGRISKDIAQKIRDAAAALNYRPNQIAKSLKTKKTLTVGLIIADISNSFSSTIARIIEDEADRLGYTVIFGSSDENAGKVEKLVATLLNRQVDGLIIFPPASSESLIEQLRQQGVPFVLVDRYFPAIATNWVSLDNHLAAGLAVEHLLGNGYQRIGLMNYDSPLHHLCERTNGWKEYLLKGAITPLPGWLMQVSGVNDRIEIEDALQEMMSAIDAIIFASNRLAITGLQYLSRRSMKVPQDLAVIGFDETEAYEFFHPPLTFIRQPLREMGESALHILLEQIQSGISNTKQVVVTPELIIRESSFKRSIY